MMRPALTPSFFRRAWAWSRISFRWATKTVRFPMALMSPTAMEVLPPPVGATRTGLLPRDARVSTTASSCQG